jgi:hypothetical protein
MLDLIATTRWLEATDSRDRIYSLLSLVDVDNPPRADYELSYEELIRSVDISSVRNDRDLTVLSFFDRNSLRTPSSTGPWAPNWLSAELPRTSFYESTYFKATGNRRAEVNFSTDGRKLTLRGIILDGVVLLGNLFDHEAVTAVSNCLKRIHKRADEYLMFMASARSVAADVDPSSHPGQSPEEAFWRTMIGNTDSSKCVPSKDFANTYHTFMEALVGCNRQIYADEKQARLGMEYETVLGQFIGGRIICRTKDGYLGMVPSSAEPGDKICAFLGGDSPFVIRSKGNGYWQLIGECYVHCMMDGEILQLPDFEERLEDIVLF